MHPARTIFEGVQKAAITLVAFCFLLDSALANTQWLELDVAQDNGYASRLIIVDSISARAEFTLESSSAPQIVQASPLAHGIGALFFISGEPVSQRSDISLKYRNLNQAGVVPRVRSVEIRSSSSEHDAIALATQLLSGWPTLNVAQARVLLQSLGDRVSNLSTAFPAYYELLDIYLSFSYKSEAYAEVLEVSQAALGSDLSSGDCDHSNESMVNAQILAANAQAAIGRFDDALRMLKNIRRLCFADSSSGAYQRLRRLTLDVTIETLAMQVAYLANQHGKLDQSLKTLIAGLKQSRALGDFQLIANYEAGLSTLSWFQNRYDDAEYHQQQAVAAQRKLGASVDLATAYNNLAIVYLWQGKIRDAQRALVAGVEVIDKFPGNSLRGYLQLNLADAYTELGEYRLAVLNAKRAMGAFEKVDNDYALAMAKLKLGTAYRGLTKPTLAVRYHQQARSLLAADSQSQSRYATKLLEIDTELAADYLLLGDTKQAEAVLQDASCRNDSDPTQTEGLAKTFIPSELRFIKVKAKIHLNAGAAAAFDNCMRLASRLLATDQSSSKFSVERLEIKLLQMEYALSQNDLAATDAHVESMLKLIYTTRSTLDASRLGPSWSIKTNQMFRRYVSSLANGIGLEQSVTGQYAQRLYEFIEKSVANDLLRVRDWSGAEAKHHSDTTLRQVISYEMQAATAVSDEQREVALASAADTIQRFVSEGMFEPAVHQLASNTPKPIQEVQQSLADNEMVLRFLIHEKTALRLEVTKAGWRFKPLAVDYKELTQTINELNRAVKSRSGQFNLFAARLSSMLGLPQLDFDAVDKVILVKGGLLGVVPFDILPVTTANGSSVRVLDLADIISTYSISQYFSDDLSAPLQADERSVDLAVFADPTFSISADSQGEDDSAPLELYRSWATSLSRLPATADEAQSIEKQFARLKSHVVVGRDATSRALLSETMRNAKVLHIATHGYYNQQTPNVVGIATAEPRSGDGAGFVSLSTLSRYRFNSNLVVISGCETSMGRQVGGEGRYSLAREFIAAGAGAVVGTLWKIPDKPSAEFMRTFYQNLNNNGGLVSEALAEAKRSFSKIAKYRHPYFWAGFTLTSFNKSYDDNVFGERARS